VAETNPKNDPNVSADENNAQVIDLVGDEADCHHSDVRQVAMQSSEACPSAHFALQDRLTKVWESCQIGKNGNSSSSSFFITAPDMTPECLGGYGGRPKNPRVDHFDACLVEKVILTEKIVDQKCRTNANLPIFDIFWTRKKIARQSG
jgi:hypothetical protein